MTVRAHIAPVTDLLNRKIKVYLVDGGYGREQRVRSFDEEHKEEVDGAQVLPDSIRPLQLTHEEAEALHDSLREFLGRPTKVNEDFWQRRFEEERALNGKLVDSLGRLA